MADLLYLVHRMPYPPDKGDKVRSYHLLRHLAQRHRVHLGTFIDDPRDEAHLPAVRALCASVHAVRLHPLRAKVAGLGALIGGEALTLGYYRDASLRRWAEQTASREPVEAAVVFSSSMAQFAEGLGLPTFVDFVDVDSAKWSAYAERRPWPLSWLYRVEGERLLAYERRVAATAARSFFVTEREAELFRSLAPECAPRVEPISNGVDAEHFSPDAARPSPFGAAETPLVFTGAMDYWPNVDAVTWFAAEVLPLLRARHPALRLHIVGRDPARAVQALAGEGVHVTGTVPDVRPYLQHAAVVVAPLRVARGVQNKVLEAMAMARPVVAMAACAEPLSAEAGRELLVARDAAGFAEQIESLLADRARADAIGQQARRRVLSDYSWDAHLGTFDRRLEAAAVAA